MEVGYVKDSSTFEIPGTEPSLEFSLNFQRASCRNNTFKRPLICSPKNSSKTQNFSTFFTKFRQIFCRRNSSFPFWKIGRKVEMQFTVFSMKGKICSV